MQTFLPYPDFALSASVLDTKRLGKQRVETLQILNSLYSGGGWQNHPAVRMWAGYESALIEYGLAICDEWLRRGYRDSCRLKLDSFNALFATVDSPPWLGGEIHETHRAALLYKLPSHYSQFDWPETPVINYFWPRSSHV